MTGTYVETFVCIHSNYVWAGIVLHDDQVVEAAPILRYMADEKWSREQVREYVTKKKWKAKIIHEREVPAVGGRQHAPSKDAGKNGKADKVQRGADDPLL
jgi:hypothetical protein